MQEETKVNRILGLYTKLMNGHLIYKPEEAVHYHVTQRTIQRDIEDIRKFLDRAVVDTGIINTILYDREKRDIVWSRRISYSSAIVRFLLFARFCSIAGHLPKRK